MLSIYPGCFIIILVDFCIMVLGELFLQNFQTEMDLYIQQI